GRQCLDVAPGYPGCSKVGVKGIPHAGVPVVLAATGRSAAVPGRRLISAEASGVRVMAPLARAPPPRRLAAANRATSTRGAVGRTYESVPLPWRTSPLRPSGA